LPVASSAAEKCYGDDDFWTVGDPRKMPQDTDYVCGDCEFVIATSIASAQRIASVETECPCCGAVNEVATGAD
jgi:hypothetical protein